MGVFFNGNVPGINMRSEDMAIRNTEESKQYSKGKFHNRVEWQQPSFFEFSGTMWDFIFKGGDRTPDMELPRKEVDLKYFNSKDPDGLNSTWVGHSSLMINIDGYRILTDPVYEKKVSFFGPTRFNGDVPLDPNKLENIDIVIVSHNHYDHMNKYSIKLLADKTKLFIVPLAVGAELERWGVPRGKIVRWTGGRNSDMTINW